MGSDKNWLDCQVDAANGGVRSQALGSVPDQVLLPQALRAVSKYLGVMFSEPHYSGGKLWAKFYGKLQPWSEVRLSVELLEKLKTDGYKPKLWAEGNFWLCSVAVYNMARSRRAPITLKTSSEEMATAIVGIVMKLPVI